MNISIIGAGNMAKGIGARLLSGGHTVTFYVRDTEKAKDLLTELSASAEAPALVKKMDAALDGEVVILAVPYTQAAAVIKELGQQLQKKIVVDITNPVDFQAMTLVTKGGVSAAEEIAKLVPAGTKVLKAFNTTFAGTLMSGTVDGKPLDVFIAGDDADAKKIVSGLVTDGGMRAFDAGPLHRAHYLEAMAVLLMSVQGQSGTPWMSGVKILP